MKSRISIAALVSTVLLPFLLADSAQGQGLLRRLRNRIAPQIAPPLPSRLPLRDARPSSRSAPGTTVPRPGQPTLTPTRPNGAAAPAASRSLGTAVPRSGQFGTNPLGASPFGASQINPTPGASRSPVAQASGSTPADSDSGAPDLSGLGSSILRPFDDNQPTQNQTPTRPTIGIQAVEANPGYPGIQVIDFKTHSKAYEAGLRKGDYIFAINGVATPSLKSVTSVLDQLSAGDTVRLRIGRAGQVSDLDVPLVQQPSMAALAKPPLDSPGPTVNERASVRMGAEVRDIPGSRGVAVTSVQASSPAKNAGLQSGDRIISINGRMIQDTSALQQVLVASRPGDSVDLQLVRGGQLVRSTVQLVSQAELDSRAPLTGASNEDTPGTPAAQPATTADSSGTAKRADSNASPNVQKSDGAKKSDSGLLSGFGSVLGGMFGNKTPSGPQDGQPGVVDDAVEADPLALPADDVEPVTELVEAFESLPMPEPKADAPTPPAPPEAPTAEADDSSDADAEVERLRKQLEELQEKLKALESKKD